MFGSNIAEHFGIPQVKFINEQVTARWGDAGLKPSDPATDGEWCRRVHLVRSATRDAGALPGSGGSSAV